MWYTLINTFSQKRVPLIDLCITVLCACVLSVQSNASTYTDVGDETLRYYLTVLNANAKVSLPLTTWPIAWDSINESVRKLDRQDLSEREKRALTYLLQQSQRVQQGVAYESAGSIAHSHAALTGFDADYREAYEVSTALSFHSARDIDRGSRTIGEISGRLKFTSADNAVDDQALRLDGSYIAVHTKNWALGYGALDRWWGPAWQQSLILSHTARPTNGFFIKRDSNTASTWPVLSWFGPWQFTLVANTFEEERHVPNTRFLASRLAFQPFTHVEFGVFRTAQWGGDGRPENVDVLTNLLLGRDNNGSGGIEAKAEDEPGNQLAGIDLNLNVNFLHASHQFYGQVAGEDEARGLPSRTIFLLGSSHQFSTQSVDHHISLEYADTLANAGDKTRENYAYEHLVIYHSGYRHYGRPIGAATDNDTRSFSVIGNHWFKHHYQVQWQLMKADINRDDSSYRHPEGGSAFGDRRTHQVLGRIGIYKEFALSKYTHLSQGHLRVGLSFFKYRHDMAFVDVNVDSGSRFSFLYNH